jgi:hypothetical protein
MKPIHSALVALLLAAAAAFGLFAVGHTASLGASSNVSDAQVEARTKRLDRFERQIKILEAKRPPTLPALPARTSTTVPPPPRLVAPAASGIPTSSYGDDGNEHEDHEDDD